MSQTPIHATEPRTEQATERAEAPRYNMRPIPREKARELTERLREAKRKH